MKAAGLPSCHPYKKGKDYLEFLPERVPDAGGGDVGVVDIGQACGAPESHFVSEKDMNHQHQAMLH